MALFSCQQLTPATVCTLTFLVFCALWKVSIFVLACCIACFNSVEILTLAASTSSIVTVFDANSTPSNNCVYLAIAWSPLRWTSSKI